MSEPYTLDESKQKDIEKWEIDMMISFVKVKEKMNEDSKERKRKDKNVWNN